MAVAEQAKVLSFEEARRTIEQHASGLRPRGRELLPLLDAAGRVLAEPIHADRDFPPFPRATRDGYAVRSEDLQNTPITLEVIGEIRAGDTLPQPGPVEPGKAIAIMTGAAVPDGADAVVMLEHTSRTDDRVSFARAVTAGENVVPAGAEARRGDQLLSPGAFLDPAAVALAASVGRSRVLVYGKPRVAVLATGDEIVDVDIPPGANQIRNSNSYSLGAQIQAVGGEPVLLPIAPDEPGRLRELLDEGLDADLLLISGGVSAGKYDLVEPLLAQFAGEFFFTGSEIQPGRPIVFGRVLRESARVSYFLGLPGNPVSTMVTFELFARPLVEALCGRQPRGLVFLHAKLKSVIRVKTGLKRFLPARLSGQFETPEVELVRWQGSGDMTAMARSNCYLVVTVDRDRIEAGEWVPVLLRS
ncbi:MAG: molybdopterin molybdotransferase MoeA [Acidobacteria bacterium]|nr:molybdopterin molybdotransferase MoeA [Acidobacteriota bacterium]